MNFQNFLQNNFKNLQNIRVDFKIFYISITIKNNYIKLSTKYKNNTNLCVILKFTNLVNFNNNKL